MANALARCLSVALLLLLALTGATRAEEATPSARPIDRWSGVVFFCRTDPKQAWTTRACAAITADAVRQLGDAGMKVAVLEASSEPDQSRKKAQAAGFDGDKALAMVFRFQPGNQGRTRLTLVAQEYRTLPGLAPRWVQVVAQESLFDPGDWSDEAVDAASRVLGGILGYFTKPR